MIKLVRTGILKVVSLPVLGLSLAQPGAAAETTASQTTASQTTASQTTLAGFTVDARVDQTIISQLDVRLSCDSATPAQQQSTLGFDGTHEFTVSVQGRGAPPVRLWPCCQQFKT